MSVSTVENFLDMDLDYYIRMNMEGLQQLVDEVDGIDVNNKLDFDQNGHIFHQGKLELNGEEALAYVRMRKKDPQGDMGRNERQRQVIQGIINKGANLNAVTKIGSIMDILGDNMVTNMKFEDMRNLATNYRSTRKDVSTYQMTGEGTRIDNIYYLIVPDEEVKKVNGMVADYGGN